MWKNPMRVEKILMHDDPERKEERRRNEDGPEQIDVLKWMRAVYCVRPEKEGKNRGKEEAWVERWRYFDLERCRDAEQRSETSSCVVQPTSCHVQIRW